MESEGSGAFCGWCQDAWYDHETNEKVPQPHHVRYLHSPGQHDDMADNEQWSCRCPLCEAEVEQRWPGRLASTRLKQGIPDA